MNSALRLAWRRPTPGELVAVLAALGVWGWLIAPYVPQLARSAPGLAAVLALAGFLLRRSYLDAAALALLVAAAEMVEGGIGPLMVTPVVAAMLAVTRRPRFSAAAGAILLALLLAGIHLKERFAGSSLTSHDLKFFFLRFGDNVGVMASQPTLLAMAGAAVAGIAVVAWLFWRLDRGVAAAARPAALAAAVLVALGLAGWSGTLLRGEIAALGRESAWTLGGLGPYGRPFSAFLATVGRTPQWTTPPTDTREFGRRVRQQMAASPGAAQPADIVLILQESQFNPATIEGCPPELCRLELFAPSRQVAVQGPMQVHIYGGGTWLSEFAVASGTSHEAFGPAGDFAPFTVAPALRRSFAGALKAAGYRTVAVYPVPGGMMNARMAYAGYGFDRFLDSDDLGLPGSYATTDEAMHAAARRVLAQERQHGKPVFLMLITIFNHAEHGARMDRVPPAMVQRAAMNFAPKAAENVADYVWRTREFERALGATRGAVLDAGRPAVLAWFGDHQPPFGNALELRDRIRLVPTEPRIVAPKQQTWYQVSSNVAHLPPRDALQPLDVVFLPGLLAQAAGVRLDDWLAANVTAREECGGLLRGCVRPASRNAYLSYLRQDLQAFELR